MTTPTNNPLDVSYLHALVDHRFGLHPPRTAEIAELLDDLRTSYRYLAHHLVDSLPRSDELVSALEKLEESLSWAIAGVVRHQPDTTPIAQVDTVDDDPVTRIHPVTNITRTEENHP